ncbi:MAG: type II toxin-antitoxin system VapC family toxin [Proteobacteria bacterium]|nr:type II toxin-antitoxin system VapC family toxin [Pseudomonadota bacterium]
MLDASALLALIRNEPGADVVAAVLSSAVMSAVNYSEVLKKVVERGGDANRIAAFTRKAGITIIPFDEDQAKASADLYPMTKAHGMSFADRACLALGLTRGARILTAERKMAEIGLATAVKVIRHDP